MDDGLTIDGPKVQRLIEPGQNGRLGVVRSVGCGSGTTGSALAWILIESGSGMIAVGEQSRHFPGRSDVFSGPGWSMLVPPHTGFRIDGDLSWTLIWRHSTRKAEALILQPESVLVEERGDGSTARTVRTYIEEGPLIVGETISAPGGWSSWPPHRHLHEEVYCYRFSSPRGFGLHVSIDGGTDHPTVVRDGEVIRITHGWHPVVASPASSMYYLWALAGDSDRVETEVDTRYA